jgi:hypothetical protein
VLDAELDAWKSAAKPAAEAAAAPPADATMTTA